MSGHRPVNLSFKMFAFASKMAIELSAKNIISLCSMILRRVNCSLCLSLLIVNTQKTENQIKFPLLFLSTVHEKASRSMWTQRLINRNFQHNSDVSARCKLMKKHFRQRETQKITSPYQASHFMPGVSQSQFCHFNVCCCSAPPRVGKFRFHVSLFHLSICQNLWQRNIFFIFRSSSSSRLVAM